MLDIKNENGIYKAIMNRYDAKFLVSYYSLFKGVSGYEVYTPFIQKLNNKIEKIGELDELEYTFDKASGEIDIVLALYELRNLCILHTFNDLIVSVDKLKALIKSYTTINEIEKDYKKKLFIQYNIDSYEYMLRTVEINRKKVSESNIDSSMKLAKDDKKRWYNPFGNGK